MDVVAGALYVGLGVGALATGAGAGVDRAEMGAGAGDGSGADHASLEPQTSTLPSELKPPDMTAGGLVAGLGAAGAGWERLKAVAL